MAGEFGPPIIESPDDSKESTEDTKTSRKKRKAGEGLFNLAQYLSPERAEEEPKKNAFQRLWERFFPKLVDVEKQEPEDGETDGETSIKWLAPEEENREEAIVDTPYLGELNVTNEPAETEPENSLKIDQNPEPAARPKTLTPEDETTPTAGPEVPKVADAELPAPEAAAPLPLEMVSPAFAPEQAGHIEPTTPRQETVIERRSAWGPAIVAGAVVDQLSRRRDRKLRREVQQERQEIGGLKKQLAEANERRQQFEQVAKQQFERTRAEQQRFERRAEPAMPVLEKLERAHEKQPEVVERVAEKRPEAPKVPPETSPEIAPVVVLHEVEKAAEKNVPIEAAYEKRHEVKDENPANQHYGASQVGQILADLHQQTAQRHAAFTQMLGRDDSQPTGKLVPTSYRQAAMSGFWTGLVIVAILIVIGLVV